MSRIPLRKIVLLTFFIGLPSFGEDLMRAFLSAEKPGILRVIIYPRFSKKKMNGTVSPALSVNSLIFEDFEVRGAVMWGLIARNARWIRSDFTNSDLRNLHSYDSVWVNAKFTGCDLRSSFWLNSTCRSCDFRGADLRMAEFVATKLPDCRYDSSTTWPDSPGIAQRLGCRLEP